MSVSVDLERVAGQQHGRGGMLLDPRRPRDAVAGRERGAGIGRRRSIFATQIDRALAGEGRLVWGALAAPDLLLRRLAHGAGHGGTQAHDLGALVRRRGAVALLVHGVEMAL